MQTELRRLDWGRLIAGIGILAIGAVLLIDQSGFGGRFHLLDFWPLILVVIGATQVAKAEDTEKRQGGLTLAFIGCWLLIASLGLFGLDYGDSWPLVLVAIGLASLLSGTGLRSAGKGAFLILLGAWLQIAVLELYTLTLRGSWPFAVVALGLWIVLSSLLPRGSSSCCGDGDCCGR